MTMVMPMMTNMPMLIAFVSSRSQKNQRAHLAASPWRYLPSRGGGGVIANVPCEPCTLVRPVILFC